MKKSCLAILVALLALCPLVSAAPNDLDDSYAKLKGAQAAKDADAVLKLAPETAKLAKAEATGPKLEGYSDDDWPKRVDYAKGVGTLSEYALATAAAQAGVAPQKVVELMDALLAVNPKSTYLGVASGAYIEALGKLGGADKQIEGATKIVAASPSDEFALMTLADNLIPKNRPDQAFTYAERLITLMKSKAKPEGYSAEEWNRIKSTMLSRGYYDAGVSGCMRQIWKDCDSNLRTALPMIAGEKAMTGPAYFYLGVANYQISKLTTDRTKLQEALKFSQQSAAIAGPMQAQAQQNVTGMTNELRAPVVRR
jgi:tetratricopeptide (TPR) repeat protein